ncbi:MAG TPA: MGMT family protein, partial [Pirellulaceae bacterium]|nr:MGMT family protein [Pirellulaceae bacterium]
MKSTVGKSTLPQHATIFLGGQNMTMIAENRKRKRTVSEHRTLVFPTDLGWMALVCEERGVRELHFGYSSQEGLRRQRNIQPTPKAHWTAPERLWVDQLQRFARGEAVQLNDIPIVKSQGTEFQHAVLKACRAIRRGATMTYGELACQVGWPGAARAVGTVMSR